MFEITFDEDEDGHVLAVHATAAAVADLDRIADETMAQLAANDEGHRDFWLRFAVQDTDSGKIVSRCAIAC